MPEIISYIFLALAGGSIGFLAGCLISGIIPKKRIDGVKARADEEVIIIRRKRRHNLKELSDSTIDDFLKRPKGE